MALGVSVDDDAMARAWRDAAREVAAASPPGVFSGHWGWQWSLEQAGWRPLEEGEAPRGPYALAEAPWPQEADPAACLETAQSWTLPDRWWGPRVHTAAGAANLHAFVVAAQPPVETYAPWTFSDEPYDRVHLLRPCEGG